MEAMRNDAKPRTAYRRRLLAVAVCTAALGVSAPAWWALRPSPRPTASPPAAAALGGHAPPLAAEESAAATPSGRARQIISAVPISAQMAGKTGITALVATDAGWRPARIDARRGSRVRLHVRNGGERPHNLAIPAFRIYARTLRPGEENYVEFTADRSGAFAFFSNAPGEVEPDLIGVLAVTE